MERKRGGRERETEGEKERERNKQKFTDLFDENQSLQPLSVKLKPGALSSHWSRLGLPYH